MKSYQKANKTNIVKKAIPPETQVVVVNNVGNGRFLYAHDRMEHKIDLREPTSYEVLKIADLKVMVQAAKAVFTEYSILIVDVLEDDLNLCDTYAYLDLMDVYNELMHFVKDEDGIDTGCFEKFVVNSSVKQYKDVIEKVSDLTKHRLLMASSLAYRMPGLIDNKQSGYEKIRFVSSFITGNDEDDVIDVLRNECEPTDISQLM